MTTATITASVKCEIKGCRKTAKYGTLCEKHMHSTGGPSLQESLKNVSASKSETIVTGDANTVEFNAIVAEVDTLIRAQSRNFVGFMAKRGAACHRALNCKLLKARSKQSRTDLRGAGMTVLENTALAAYDPAVEQKPKIERWLSIDVVVSNHPDAIGMNSVSACEKLATLYTQIDPPRSWDAPIEYELRRQYRDKGDAIDALVKLAVKEAWTANQVADAIDVLNGAIGADPIKPKEDADPIKAARTLAIKIVESIIATTVDAETLFDELQSQLTKYGWALAPGHDAKGVETLKAVKTARTTK